MHGMCTLDFLFYSDRLLLPYIYIVNVFRNRGSSKCVERETK